jgi:hypothetical protein
MADTAVCGTDIIHEIDRIQPPGAPVLAQLTTTCSAWRLRPKAALLLGAVALRRPFLPTVNIYPDTSFVSRWNFSLNS